MMKKVLFVANTDMHIELCYLDYMKYFKDNGYEVHVATNTDILYDYCDVKHKIPIYRSPFHFKNIIAIFNLSKVIKREKYSIISTSTPMGGVITRIAANKYRKKYNSKVIYTAHGFHFFKGNSIIKNFIYYNLEKFLAKYTDILVTINEEDYLKVKANFKTDVRFIHGIGFHNNKLNNKLSKKEQINLRKKINIGKNDLVISYIAELSKRKRQLYLIDFINKYKNQLPKCKVLLIGGNILGDKVYKKIKKYHLESCIKVLGFRDDISDLLDITDIVISVSGQEGLPLNIMEAMYKEKAIIASDCRGNRDLIINDLNGLIVPLKNDSLLLKSILSLYNNPKYSKMLGEANRNIINKYTIDEVLPQYIKIYKELCDDANI